MRSYPYDSSPGPEEARWKELEKEFEKYQEAGISAGELYRKAGTPHERMREVSVSIAGPAVGVENVEELLSKVKLFAQNAVGSAEGGRGNIREAEEALQVLRTFHEQSQSAKDAKQADRALAQFARARIEEFAYTIDQRNNLGTKPLDTEKLNGFKQDLEVPLDQMRRFGQGPEAFYQVLAGQKVDQARLDLYNFRREYPAVFYAQILNSIQLKADLYHPEKWEADPFNPMVSTSELERVAKRTRAG